MSQNSLFKEYQNAFEPEGSPSGPSGPEKKGRAFGYSPFALQDAIGAKDKKKVWIEYEKLRLSGISPDEIVHNILSKARDMLAISRGASKEDLNIKSDYPYNKSKRDAKNWQTKSLKQFYTRLVSIYHNMRLGEGDLDTELELAILGI